MAEKIKKRDVEDKKLFAFLATFLSVIGFVIALAAKREDKYVMFYAKQSLVIFIIGVVAGAIGSVFKLIPIIGMIIYFALTILVLIVWILSWINALSEKEKDLPIISYWAEKINL